jgi:hypothetical protein
MQMKIIFFDRSPHCVTATNSQSKIEICASEVTFLKPTSLYQILSLRQDALSYKDGSMRGIWIDIHNLEGEMCDESTNSNSN